MNIDEISAKEEEAKNLITDQIEKARKNGIEQVEIFCSYTNQTEITLEKNDLNQSIFAEETMYGIRVIAGNCQGFVATNDSSTIYQSILDAKAIAASQNTPDEAMELPEPGFISEVDGLYNSEIDEISSAFLMDIVRESLDLKNSEFPNVNLDSAEFAISKGFKLIASSKGVLASEKEALLSSSFMGMATENGIVGSFDYDSAYGRSFSDFKTNHFELFREFMQNCMNSLKALPVESFKGNLIIPPRNITGFLLGNLLASLTASMVRKGKSKFSDKIGQTIASKFLTVTDNPQIADYMGSTSFDREGQPTENMTIIRDGRLENYFYNHFEAVKAGKDFSANALGGASSTPSCGPRQIQVEPGGSMLNDILNLNNSVILNRFSGSSDSASGDFSGVVKGSSVIKNGATLPVKEIQITGNIYESLNNITHVSFERKLVHSSSMMPWIVIKDIDVTGI